MSDRIVILRDGRIQQDGSPGDLYNRPANAFVADFLGKSNFISAQLTGKDGNILHCNVSGATFDVETDRSGSVNSNVELALRPERLRIGPPGTEALPARISRVSYLGERCQIIVDQDKMGELLVSSGTWKSGITPEPGLDVSIGWDRDACVVLERE